MPQIGNHNHVPGAFSAPTGPTSIRTQRQMISNMEDPEAEPVDIRESYWSDIGNVIQASKNDNHLVIVMGDFNESLFGGRRHALADLCKKHNLVDPIQLKHAQHCDTPTFIHGSHRIDYIVMDESLMDGCVRCGILPFDPAFSPSHRAVYCDISLDAVFGTPAVNLISSRTRLITPSDQRTCEHLLTILGQSDAQSLIGVQMQITPTNVKNMELPTQMARSFAAIDKDFRSALIQAESVKSPKYYAPWSKQLMQQWPAASFGRWYMLQQDSKLTSRTSSSLSRTNGILTCLLPLVTIEEAKIGLRDAQNALKIGQIKRTPTASSNVG